MYLLILLWASRPVGTRVDSEPDTPTFSFHQALQWDGTRGKLLSFYVGATG